MQDDAHTYLCHSLTFEICYVSLSKLQVVQGFSQYSYMDIGHASKNNCYTMLSHTSQISSKAKQAA